MTPGGGMGVSAHDLVTRLKQDIARIRLPYKDRWLDTYVVNGPCGTIIVDAGPRWDDERMKVLEEVCATSRGPHFLVLTHLDADHRGAASRVVDRFPHAVVIAGVADTAGLMNPAVTIAERYDGVAPPDGALGSGIAVHIKVDEPVRLDIGGEAGAWQVIGLGGHTAGHVGLFQPARRILIAGDALQRDGTPDRAGELVLPPIYVDADLYRATLQRIGQLRPELLLEAHLGPTSGQAVEDAIDCSLAWADRLRTTLQVAGADLETVAASMGVRANVAALRSAINAELLEARLG